MLDPLFQKIFFLFYLPPLNIICFVEKKIEVQSV